MTKVYDFFASAPRGLEELLTEELHSIGAADARPGRSGVSFSGPLSLGYRICLWSRVAARVLMPLATFPVTTPEELYAGVRTVDWREHIGVGRTMAVHATLIRSPIGHSQYAALKAKDAVVDQFRETTGERPSVDTLTPDVRLHLHLEGEQGTISIDLSGESLHKRGYREDASLAPMKENLAAAVLIRAGWPKIAAEGGGLIDPMCGGGTFPIEAAMMAGDIAPGLLRQRWGFSGWKGHDEEEWEKLLEEARKRREAGLASIPPICGFDADSRAVRGAWVNAAGAGLETVLHFERRDVAQMSPWPRTDTRPGLVVVNPPYGERLGEVEGLRPLYAQMGERLKESFAGWKAAVFTANEELGHCLGLRAHRVHNFYNGALRCRLLHFDIDPSRFSGADRPAGEKRPLSEGAQMFANRLRKNLKPIGKWARREGVECYRVYDADMPEYSVAVDLYGEWVHVQEYKAPPSIDDAKAAERLREVMTALPEVLDVPREKIFLKVRQKQKGVSQYERLGRSGVFHEVSEGPCRFLVNFTDYLDTGLFLDHRLTRALVGSMAVDKRVLNLFGYTGTATVHAALGGAHSTVTVDKSRTYLEWARRNFELNRLDPRRHTVVSADCLQWIHTCKERFDLIFLDPPTFSNAKDMKGTFDVQRDHPGMIRAAVSLLAPGGVLIFSNNNRRFRMDPDLMAELRIEDITASTIPRDFERNPKIHNCWRIQKR